MYNLIHSLSNTRSPKSQLLVLESTFYGELIFIVISAINTFPQYQRGLNLVAAPCIGTFSIVKSSEKIYVLLILGVRKFDTAPYIGSSWFLRSLYWNIFYTKIFKKMKKGSLYWRAPWCEDPLYWIGSVLTLTNWGKYLSWFNNRYLNRKSFLLESRVTRPTTQ